MRAKIKIMGLVQGVFFRAFVRDNAVEMGLKGFVRNKENRLVEVTVEGDEPKIKKLINYCRKGPTAAKVEDVKVEWFENEEEFKKFEIIY